MSADRLITRLLTEHKRQSDHFGQFRKRAVDLVTHLKNPLVSIESDEDYKMVLRVADKKIMIRCVDAPPSGKLITSTIESYWLDEARENPYVFITSIHMNERGELGIPPDWHVTKTEDVDRMMLQLLWGQIPSVLSVIGA